MKDTICITCHKLRSKEQITTLRPNSYLHTQTSVFTLCRLHNLFPFDGHMEGKEVRCHMQLQQYKRKQVQCLQKCQAVLQTLNLLSFILLKLHVAPDFLALHMTVKRK